MNTGRQHRAASPTADSARGSHLQEGHVRPTPGVVLTEAPARLHRGHDPQAGLALLDLPKELP